MKQILTVVMCIAAVVAMTACGGGNSKKRDANLEKAGEKVVHEAIKDKAFAKAGQTKIASFGKTEKDKRVVSRDDYKSNSDFYVVEYSADDREWGATLYKLFYDKNDYKTYIENTPVKTKDEDGLWISRTMSKGFPTWQEAYDYYKNDRGYKLIE